MLCGFVYFASDWVYDSQTGLASFYWHHKAASAVPVSSNRLS